jgi:antitoxin MazE
MTSVLHAGRAGGCLTPYKADVDTKRHYNNLGVQLPASVTRAARLTAKQRVRITGENGCVIITPDGDKPPTLTERLALFDPAVHGGEAMAAAPLGQEVW